ncbi:MAG: TonB-dependent receptor [Bacteroidota bacterium]
MNIHKIIFLIAFILSAQLYAQQYTLNGTIKNEKGEPLELVTVNVLNTNIGTATDLSGQFNLPLNYGTLQLEIRAVGFATQIKTINFSESTASVEIELRKNTINLDEILVTAQRIEQNIIEAPISVTSISSKKVESTRTWDLNTLNGLVPNYVHQELGVGFQQVQVIRGIQVFSENPAIATYVDGVNQLDILANGFQLIDVERIEVLRGPQGTLFGRNAMGGVVNIITKEPTNEKSGFFEANLGNLGLQRYAVGVRGPIIEDKLFFGANGLFQRREGFQKVDTTGTINPDFDIQGKRVGDQDSYYGNLYFKWLLNERFDAKLNVKVQTDISDASSFFISTFNEEVALANPNTLFLSRIGTHERNVLNSALSLKYRSPRFNLSSTTTYQRIGIAYENIESGGIFHSIDGIEIGGTPAPQEVYSQEFKIQSNPASRLNYTAGAFAYFQDAFEPSTNLAQELTPSSFVIFRNEGSNNGVALFGQIGYELTERIELTGGLRYDYENREATFNGFFDLLLNDGQLSEVMPDTTVSGDYSALSPKASLSYEINNQSNAYFTYTRGFRAGGINPQRLPEGLDQTFDPEFSDNFELGYKSNLLNNKVYLAASAFYIQWDDLQFFNLVAAPSTFARENVGDATSYGFELEVSAVPVKNLQFDGSFGYNETEYETFSLSRAIFDSETFFPIGQFETEIGGNRLSNAPRTTLYLAGQYDYPISENISFSLRGEFRNIGSYFTDIQNDLEQDSYSLVSCRAGFNFPKASFYFWGQNLNDERFIAFGSADTSFSRSTRISPPRTYGFTLRAEF